MSKCKTLFSHIILMWLLCFSAELVAQETLLAAAQIPGGKWGFINTKGHFQIAPRWDYVSDFSEGKAVVANFKNRGPLGEEDMGGIGEFGFIDKTGNLIISLRFSYAEPFESGFALVNLEGETPQAKHEMVTLGKWAYINPEGKVVFELERGTKGYSYKDGMARFEEDRHWGYLNFGGQVSIPPKFADATDFNNSKAFVKMKASDTWQLLDKRGSVVGNLNAQKVTCFEGGKASTKREDRWGISTSSGIFFAVAQANKLSSVSEGTIRMTNNKGRSGYCDVAGKIIIPFQFGSDSRSFHEGLAAVSISAVVADTSKKQNHMNENSFSVFGFVDKTGKMVIPQRYLDVRDFHEGLCAVKESPGGMVGYINLQGQRVIAPRFVKARDFHLVE